MMSLRYFITVKLLLHHFNITSTFCNAVEVVNVTEDIIEGCK